VRWLCWDRRPESAPHDPAGLVNYTYRRPLEASPANILIAALLPSLKEITSGRVALPAGEQQPHVWDVLD